MSECNPETVTDQREWRSLPERVKRVWLLRSVFTDTAVILVCAVLAVIFIASDWWGFWQALVLGLVAAWMLVSPVVRWLTTGYRMDEHGITQRSGVFNRTRTTIAYDHIHTLSSSAPIYMRPFHVVILDITAAGGESGMTLRGVPAGVQLELEAARQLDSGDTVSAAAASVGIHGAVADTADTAVADSDAAEECRQPEEAPAAGARTGVNQSATGRPAIDGELVFRASVADIVLFAVTDLGLFAALIVVYGFLDQLRDLVPEDVFDTAQDSVIRFATSSAAMIAGAVVVVFAVLVGASIIGSLLRFYGFEVWRRGGDLVVRSRSGSPPSPSTASRPSPSGARCSAGPCTCARSDWDWALWPPRKGRTAMPPAPMCCRRSATTASMPCCNACSPNGGWNLRRSIGRAADWSATIW